MKEKDWCDSCKEPWASEQCNTCKYGYGKENNYKPKTNADRIRAMTDEELAFYIVNHPMWSDESACVAWLKEPIMEGESENPN